MSLDVVIIKLKGHPPSCKLSTLLPESNYGKSNLTLADLPAGIDSIILTSQTLWHDDKRRWCVYANYKVLSTQYYKSDQPDFRNDYAYLNHAKMIPILTAMSCSGLSDPGVLVLSSEDWLRDLMKLYGIIREEKSVLAKTAEKCENKFTWKSENQGKSIKVPYGAISVKVYMGSADDESELVFLLSNGFTQLLHRDDMGHIQSMDYQKPYIWVGLPKDTVYIACDNELKYKFSCQSKNIYRGITYISNILPQNYMFIKDGTQTELVYSEEKQKHVPELQYGVLIMGQS